MTILLRGFHCGVVPLAITGVGFNPTPCFADKELRLTGLTSSSARITANGSGTVVKSSRGAIYSLTMMSNTANAEIAIYDNATTASGTVVWEGRTAVANDSYAITFSKPLLTDNGITAQVQGGIGFVEFE